MPIILATWEAEIRRITGSRPALAKMFGDSISMEKKLGMMAHTCCPSYERKCKTGGYLSRLAWAKSGTLSPK
jgi:hypothetical protein